MKALTLHQPWATLVAIGAKRIETRSWYTLYRGPLAIHAGLSTTNIECFFDEPFLSLLTGAGIRGVSDLPLGKIVCVTKLANCVETNLIERFVQPFTETERAFGNYEPGRYGWLFEDVRPFERAIPARGAQGLWEWSPPACA